MNLSPVIVRELRQQARRPMTYWVRPLAMGAALLAIALLDPEAVLEPNAGGRVFTLLHKTLFFTIWICAPLLTADCLSHERREETLGLLFLTPLKAWEVVAAKGLAHGLRAASLVLAVVPALAVPILLGGVNWQQVAFSAVILTGSLVLALSAGLVASGFCRARNRAFLLAVLLAGGALLAEILLTGVFLYFALDAIRHSGSPDTLEAFFELGWVTLLNESNSWNEILRLFPPGVLLQYSILLAGVFVALFSLVIVLAACRLRSALREKPPSKIRLWLADFFFAPAYAVGFYSRWLKHGLQKNPIGWLEKRRWSGRLAAWIWLTIAAVFVFGACTRPEYIDDPGGHATIRVCFVIMILNMVVMAVGSFGRERASGVMELLLITPMSEAQIITGRLRGIWAQFLPGALVILAAWAIASLVLRYKAHYEWNYYGEDEQGMALFSPAYLLAMFFMLPVFGLYFSLRIRFFLVALIVTLLISLVIPLAASGLAASLMMEYYSDYYGYYNVEVWLNADPLLWLLHLLFVRGGLPTLWLLGMGSWLLHRLHRRLVQRKFSYQTG